MIDTVQQLLQSFMDMEWNGQVGLHICDGVPGNCTVYPVDAGELERSRSLQGQLRVRYRSRFRLLYLADGGNSGWMERLQAWLAVNCEDATLELTGCRLRPEGTAEHTAILTLEYTRDHPEEEV